MKKCSAILPLVSFVALFLAKESKTCMNEILGSSASLNEFSFKIGKEISNTESGNIIFSPLSIYTALAMVEVGARKETKSEIESALKWNDEAAQLRKIKCLTGDLTSTSENAKASLSIANKVWTNRKSDVLMSFKKVTSKFLYTEIGTEPFSNNPEKSRESINLWISKKTGGHIKEMFPPRSISSDDSIVIANAIFFKGKWAKPFKKEDTRDGPFYLADNRVIQVPYMWDNDKYPHGIDEVEKVQLLQIPYESKSLSMIFAIPLSSNIEFVSNNADIFKKWVRILKNSAEEDVREIDVAVPKFKVKDSIDLDKYLNTMGIRQMFSPSTADLSGISADSKLYVSKMLHKSFLEVDEEGTVATSATGVLMPPASMPEHIEVDRPFLFFIIHNESESIIFSGKVTNPLE